jgi:predicted permease
VNEFLTVLNAVLPIFFAAAAGIVMRKINWLTEEADQSLLRVTVNLLAPCLIIDSILKNHALREPGNLLVAPLVGFGTVLLGFGVARAALRWMGLQNEAERRTFAFTTGIYNYGYVPLPLALSLFDRETAGVLFVHNVGVEVAFWTVGLLVLGDESWRKDWRKVFSPPLIAILVAVPLNFWVGDDHLPRALLATVQMLGQCAVPMGLVLIGAIMADHLAAFHEDMRWGVMAWACAVRLAVLPMLFLALAWLLPFPTELKRVMLLQATMPAAVFPIVMAKHYHGDPATALRVVIGTSLVALATIPFWIRFGMSLLGL